MVIHAMSAIYFATPSTTRRNGLLHKLLELVESLLGLSCAVVKEAAVPPVGGDLVLPGDVELVGLGPPPEEAFHAAVLLEGSNHVDSEFLLPLVAVRIGAGKIEFCVGQRPRFTASGMLR